MPRYIQEWTWMEAFDKFGFGDGEDTNHTQEVVDVLKAAGYVCNPAGGMHNYYMDSLKKDGQVWEPNLSDGFIEQMDENRPRTWLPGEVVDLLDKAFPDKLVIRVGTDPFCLTLTPTEFYELYKLVKDSNTAVSSAAMLSLWSEVQRVYADHPLVLPRCLALHLMLTSMEFCELYRLVRGADTAWSASAMRSLVEEIRHVYARRKCVVRSE